MLSPRPIVVAWGRRQRHLLSSPLSSASAHLLPALRLRRSSPSPCTYATSAKNEGSPRLLTASCIAGGSGEARHLPETRVHRWTGGRSARLRLLTYAQGAPPRESFFYRSYSQSIPASLSVAEENASLESSMSASTSADDHDPPQPKLYSYPELTADAARHKAGLQDPDVPPWQNPLHHNNPEMQKIFPEDFDTQEEFEASILPAPAVATPDNPDAAPSHVVELAEEIVLLNMLEMSELVNKIADHYGFHEGMLSPDGTLADGGADDIDGDDNGAAAPAPAEKTSWDVKLVGFQDTSKIKIIKEVRSLAGLGLKEAKELVEGAPKVVLKQVKTDDANAIKAKLEELGATVELT